MRFKHSPWLALMAALVMVLSACGGGPTPPAAEAPTAPPAAQPAAEATAPPAAEAPTAPPAAQPAPEATPIMQFTGEAQPNQKTVVWMVRSGPDENRWERDVVLPGWQKAQPGIFLKVLNIVQNDIAVKREAMIAAK